MHNVLDASKALLVEVAHMLNGMNVTYVIVGGWSPYLRNATEIPHPGTRDVDVLFSDADAKEGIREVVKAFVEQGFVVSAKHDFQLLKPIVVDGQELMFNVDLLHPSETVENPEKMVDHLNLHVLENEFGPLKSVKSIVLPSSRILFETELHSVLDVSCPLTERVVPVPLISEAGCVLSKCESVTLEKRHRDSFDIYLSIVSRGSERIAQDIHPFGRLDGIQRLIAALGSFIEQRSQDGTGLEFDRRVGKYMKRKSSVLPSKVVRDLVNTVQQLSSPL